MSQYVVVPPRIISASPSRAPTRTNSSVTFFASAGKMYFVSHSCKSRSSASPRNSTIGMCVAIDQPRRDHFPKRENFLPRRVSTLDLGPWSNPTMRPFATAMPPSSITRRVRPSSQSCRPESGDRPAGGFCRFAALMFDSGLASIVIRRTESANA